MVFLLLKFRDREDIYINIDINIKIKLIESKKYRC